MRAWAALLLLLLLPSNGPAAAAPSGDWRELLIDPRGDVREGILPVGLDPRADLLRVEARADADQLEIRLVSGKHDGIGSDGATTFESVVSFSIARQGELGLFEIVVTDDGFDVRGAASGALRSAEGWPHAWTMTLERAALFGDGVASGETLRIDAAEIRSEGSRGATHDAGSGGGSMALPDAPPGPDGRAPPLSPWREIVGVDYAGGPSIAAAPDGTFHVAYFVYNDDRSERTGLYHATLDGRAIRAQRVADHVMPGPIHQDRNSTTAIAVDEAGRAHILHYPRPWTGGGIQYVTNAAASWVEEDPAAGARATDDVRSTATIAARAGRVVAAFQIEGDRVALTERTDAGWTLLRTIDDARSPRVAIDADGQAHVAWLRPEQDGWPNRGVDGDLIYAREAEGWREIEIAQGITEQTKFWKQAEADGTFDMALAPDGTTHFVWEGIRSGPRYTVLQDDTPFTSASGLTPGHGNPQLRMRLAIDAEGRSHVATGYGSLDLFGLRTSSGAWAREELEQRYSMPDLAVTSGGRAAIVGTQGHGGTTLAILVRSANAEHAVDLLADGDRERPRLPVPGAGAALGALALGLACLAQSFQTRRR